MTGCGPSVEGVNAMEGDRLDRSPGGKWGLFDLDKLWPRVALVEFATIGLFWTDSDRIISIIDPNVGEFFPYFLFILDSLCVWGWLMAAQR